ncbi:MAG: pyridoxamine 5'-phosphate oxidase family protein [Eubacteriales bacterium]|nr:pyridoxamine 5'-phosphate oxidase family protein [Eubacteriales bacterium]
MFRPIRKKKNQISDEAAKELLRTSRRGVFAVNGDDGYPYAIPINFLYDEDAQKIYFHGSRAGHKVDSLRACDKVCFTVYGNETIKDEPWAPYMQSVVVFGRCRLLESGEESLALVKRFAMKYYPDESLVDIEIAEGGKAVQMYEISIEHYSGKEVQER